jgi:hypothetical protein
MSLVDTIIALSERWLSDRTFEFVVAPAIADWQYDSEATGMRRARNSAAVVSAFLWGVYEEVVSDPAGLLTFAMIALIPTCYYTMLIIVCAPVGGRPMSYPLSRTELQIALGLAVFILSLTPALVCYWPERAPRRTTADR